MNYKEFIKLLQSNNLKSVYLFYGEENYLIDELVKRVKTRYIDENLETLNYSVLEGKDITFDRLVNACETLPFMAEKKIVVIKEFPLFKSQNKMGEELEGLTEARDKKRLAKYIEGLGSHICLIFMEKLPSIRKNNFLYKAINKSGGLVELKKLRGMELDNWIEDRFKEYNRTIGKYDLSYFIEQTSYFNSKDKNLYDLENEILKLANYIEDGEQVTREKMDSLMTRPLEMNIFNLLDNISRKDGQNAIKLFNEMYASNEPVLRILHMIVRQLRNMLHIKALKAKGYMEGEINSKVGLSPFEFRKVSGQSNNFSMLELERALFHCLETDKSIKTSSVDDRLVLEILITNLCFNI